MRRKARLILLLVSAAALVAACVVVPVAAGDEASRLRERAGAAKARERSLSADAAKLSVMTARLERQLAVLAKRRAQVQADLDADRAELAEVRRALRAERARLARLRARLVEVRATLADRLVASYKASDIDAVSVVLGAANFAELMERATFLQRLKKQDRDILVLVRSARVDAARQTNRLTKDEAAQRRLVAALRARRDALVGMGQAVAARRAALVRARAARLAALQATRANRRGLEKRLREVEAAMAKASSAGMPVALSGGWVIPSDIVQCESGGRNMPPNQAGAAGYYQIMPGTWKGHGGKGPSAHLAPKAEQDRIAAKIWAGGSGRDQWVCAGMVD